VVGARTMGDLSQLAAEAARSSRAEKFSAARRTTSESSLATTALAAAQGRCVPGNGGGGGIVTPGGPRLGVRGRGEMTGRIMIRTG
jgi:hypothetical protein